MATNKHLGTPNRVIIPVAGAFNVKFHTHLPRVSVVSTATFHFAPLRHAFEHNGWTVEEPIVPENMGIRDVAHTHADIEDLIDRKLVKHSGKDAVIVGHSLGGFSVARYISDGRNRERVAGGMTLDSPHLPRFVGAWRGSGPAMAHLIDRGSKFTSETARRAEANTPPDSPSRLTLVGSMGSGMVDPEGSLPAFAGAERYLFSRSEQPVTGDIQVVRGPEVNHRSILFNPEAIGFVVHSAGALLDRHHHGSQAQPLAMTG